MIRITGGALKGRFLKSPQGKKVRPTRSVVREAIFDMLGPRVVGAMVLDLFSGSGLLGLESISRGARQVFFVEQDRFTCRVLKNNIHALCQEYENPILCGPVNTAMKQFMRSRIQFDIVLMDPPYELNINSILRTLSKTDIVKKHGWVIVERSKHSRDIVPESFQEIKQKTYGQTRITIYQPIQR